VAKRASPARFGPARFWPVENGPGRASPFREKRPEITARPVPLRANGLTGQPVYL